MKAVLLASLYLLPALANAQCAPGFLENLPEQMKVDQAPLCQSYKSLTGLARTCQWAFDTDTEEAKLFALWLFQTAEYCGGTHRDAENPVNHPDAFFQVILDFEDKEVSISIKDKTAQSRVLVGYTVTAIR